MERRVLENRLLKKAIYKEFEEAAEILADVIAMIVKDMGRVCEDDYSNIEIVSQVLGIDEKLKNSLKKVNGLRNILVHEYNGVDDSLAFDSISELIPEIEKAIEVIEKWISEK